MEAGSVCSWFGKGAGSYVNKTHCQSPVPAELPALGAAAAPCLQVWSWGEAGAFPVGQLQLGAAMTLGVLAPPHL